MNASFDVVIVGGGVTGAAVGYGLAKRGVKTCLVDAVPTFSRASRANMGLIWCQSKALGCPQFVRWGFASSRAYGNLAAELKELSGIDTGYAPTGGIIPCLGEAELEARAQFIEKLRAETEDGTYPASVLSRKELEGMLPKVPFGPEVSGGIWSDMDGYVDPLHLMFAFRKSFVRLGGTLFAGERVSEVKPSGKGYTVVCGGRTLECGKAVLAAGLGVRKLAAQLGTDIPVFPNKSQVMLLERIPADVLPIPLLGNDRRGPREHGHGQEAHPRSARRQRAMGRPCLAGAGTQAHPAVLDRAARVAEGRIPHLRPDSGARERLRLRHAQRGVPCRHSGAGPARLCHGQAAAAGRGHLRAVPVRRRRLGISGIGGLVAPCRGSEQVTAFNSFSRNTAMSASQAAAEDAALVNVTFEGKPCAVPAGKTVAAALLGDAHAGYTSIHPLTGERRAPFCMMGTCFECLVEIDGQPNRQACLTIVREGMDIKRQYPDKEQER